MARTHSGHRRISIPVALHENICGLPSQHPRGTINVTNVIVVHSRRSLTEVLETNSRPHRDASLTRIDMEGHKVGYRHLKERNTDIHSDGPFTTLWALRVITSQAWQEPTGLAGTGSKARVPFSRTHRHRRAPQPGPSFLNIATCRQRCQSIQSYLRLCLAE